MKQRKDGRWQKSIVIGGKKKYFYSTAKTERQAEKDIQRQLIEYQEDETVKHKFSAVAEEWAAQHFETIAQSSIKQYKAAKKEACVFFSDIMIEQITTLDIERYIKSYITQHYGYKTVKTKLLVMNLIFKYAYMQGYVQKNPCLYVTIPKTLKREKRRSLTAEEIDIVNTSTNCTMGVYAYFLLYTGLRRSEALALKYCDIDYENKIINISKSVEYYGSQPKIKNSTKTQAGIRKIPLLSNVAKLLKSISQSAPDDFIFPNTNGNLMSKSSFDRRWQRYCKETGLDITPHMLRHTYATILFDKGIDIKTAQAWLGHANISTTMDVYTHYTDKRFKDDAEKLDSLL